MSVVITPNEAEIYAMEREMEKELEKEEISEWRMELYKMVGSLIIDITVILFLVLGALNTAPELSTRFMSLLEIVVGAIFGVTATQIAKE